MLGRRRLDLCWLALLLTATVFSAAPARAESGAPPGFVVTSRETLAPGVEHSSLVRTDPPLRVDVARISPGAAVSLRAVLSNDLVAGPAPQLERTSTMCSRVHCILAVNADFGTDAPLGGLVTDGRLLRSPSATHHQLSVTTDGELQSEPFKWSGTLVPPDLRPVSVDGVNVARPPGKIVLYTPSFGPTTTTDSPGADLVLRVIEPAGELRLGQTTLVELVSLAEGAVDSAIPAGGAVLSGEGAGGEALRQLWQRLGAEPAAKRAILRLDSADAVVESVGGSPILLKDGKRWLSGPSDSFTVGRHPRTLVGWTPGGDVLLVTVDGRQLGLSVGMSLFEAADLLLALGATEGVNLDGGGSTTFVVRGAVVNHPSDVSVRAGNQEVVRHTALPGDEVMGHVERPVSTALAVVPTLAASVPSSNPLPGIALDPPEQALTFPEAATDDARALPDDGSVPAPISRRDPTVGGSVLGVAVGANALAVATVADVIVMVRRRARLRHDRAAATED